MKKEKYIPFVIKLAITFAAGWFVVSNVPFSELGHLVKEMNPFWLLAAFGCFAFSKLFSAYRLNLFFSLSSIYIQTRENLKLYWLGMFYNQFLPGGIGGDAYKAYWIGKELVQDKAEIAKIILWDRISGLMALLILLLFMAGSLFSYIGLFLALSISGLMYLFYFYVSIRWKFTQSVHPRIEIYSWMVQLCQCVCAYCLLISLKVESLLFYYVLAFLFSSVLSVLPVTIGGLGAREMAFVFASTWLGLNKEIGVSVGFLFYLISMVASLGGIAYAFSTSTSIKIGLTSVT